MQWSEKWSQGIRRFVFRLMAFWYKRLIQKERGSICGGWMMFKTLGDHVFATEAEQVYIILTH